MGECESVRDRFSDLLVGSVDGATRETVLQHVETCEECSREWQGFREAWRVLGEVQDLPVPDRVRARFEEELAREFPRPNVVPFRSRIPLRWIAQAAGVALLVGGSFFAGRQLVPARPPVPVVSQSAPTLLDVRPVSLAEKMEVPATNVSPQIIGNPDIRNVSVVPTDDGNQVNVSFDITSAVTIKGRPDDKSLIQLLAYVLQNQKNPTYSRAKVIQWVQDTYSDGSSVDPEIVRALAHVLVSDSHEGVRLKAIDALRSLPGALDADAKKALLTALRNDPNPAVRMKAVDVLARAAARGAEMDHETLETLREKAAQNDENPYVRVKAAETLSRIGPKHPR